MTTKTCFHLAAALCLGISFTHPLRAAETTLDFNNLEEINAAFPEALRSGAGKGGYVLACEEASSQLSLKTETGKVARGTVYSAETYAPALDFLAAPVTISFAGASLEYPKKGSGYIGRFGVTSSTAGALSNDDREKPNTGNAIFFEINRRTNTFRLVQLIQGVTSTLAEWSNTDLISLAGGSDSINNIAVQKLDLMLSAKKWQIAVVFISKRNSAVSTSKEASGEFSPEWTAQTWGSSTFIGAEADQQLSQDASENDASTNLLLGPITIVPNPSFSRAASPAAPRMTLLAHHNLHLQGML